MLRSNFVNPGDRLGDRSPPQGTPNEDGSGTRSAILEFHVSTIPLFKIPDKKGYIHFWCKVTPDNCTMTEQPCYKQNKG